MPLLGLRVLCRGTVTDVTNANDPLLTPDNCRTDAPQLTHILA